MSYDFTVLIPELIGTHEEASALHDAMYTDPDTTAVPDVVERFIDALHALDGYGTENDDAGFLSVAPIEGDARGAVVPTWIGSIPENRAAMLELTRARGLGLYDPQWDRLYDPRGHIQGLTVTFGDGWDVPLPQLAAAGRPVRPSAPRAAMGDHRAGRTDLHPVEVPAR